MGGTHADCLTPLHRPAIGTDLSVAAGQASHVSHGCSAVRTAGCAAPFPRLSATASPSAVVLKAHGAHAHDDRPSVFLQDLTDRANRSSQRDTMWHHNGTLAGSGN
jgi:hypothetical protein